MSWFYRSLIRPVLFAQDPEEIHLYTIARLAWASRHELVCEAIGSFFKAPELPMNVFGLRFPNPVGLAAGMDKDGQAVPVWAALGFGHCELGAVTWQAQPGNPSPRVFRAIADEALVNRMGFNNAGAAALAEQLDQWHKSGQWPDHPVGINLGKTKTTPLERAAEDYAQSFRVLWPQADFFVVNVSSPNTPNLRQLQDKAALDEILAALQQAQRSLTNDQDSTPNRVQAARQKPVLVKVAPDLAFEALDQILELVGPRQIAGIVATNTALARPESSDPDLSRVYAEEGGLSGRPLRARSTEVIRHLYCQTRGALPIIGVGGIFSADDAWEKIAAGASLVQIYTSLVYEGPGVVRKIVEGLLDRLGQAGFRELAQAVGCENRG
ncbi:MAG: quinone-dependent dihydroorotate dehydrogenase [Candidatus Omnitrophica bacterium]|nr:quinone-dependent dihydroorotate dehydrogenase [Candidatus Omnitrophota bacterium]